MALRSRPALVALCLVLNGIEAHPHAHHEHASSSPLDAFLSPVAATIASGGDLSPSFVVDTPADCASACLSNATCISFNTDSTQQPPTKTCGIVGECYAPNSTSCPSYLTLSCVGGVFSSVLFASYGEPVVQPGQCGFSYGTCNAPTASAVIAAACINRSWCSIDAQLATFGGVDPCVGQYKFVAASLSGNCTNAPPPAGQLMCTLSGSSQTYALTSAGVNASYWLRIAPRNDTAVAPAVPFAASVPLGNVSLAGSGLLAAAFSTNLAFLVNGSRGSTDDLLYPYRKRHDPNSNPPGGIWGWDDFVPGSVASLVLMGAGNALRWHDDAALRETFMALLDGIAAAVDDDGFAVGYPEAMTNAYDGGNNQLPSYVNSWFTHGMLESAPLDDRALAIARAFNSWWNNCTYIPQLFPQAGGPAYTGPLPHGFDPANGYTSTSPFANGHLLYWLNQAGIGHSRMATSALGTQADVDFLVNAFEETWWLESLAARNLTAIYLRDFYPDNYEVCVLEAYMDLYLMTAQPLYLAGVLGAWAMLRDPTQGWLFPGGSFAINENYLYPPGSFPLEFAGSWGVHTRPTGEMCPSSFWIRLNQRLHRLWPTNESFTGEIERSLINVGMAGQTPGGVRYFARLHGVKDAPTSVGTCCEGQSVRTFGASPEFIFSLDSSGGGGLVYVNLFEPATLLTTTAAGDPVTVTVATAWPFDTRVDVLVALSGLGGSGGPVPFSLSLRIPAWAQDPLNGSAVPVLVDGTPAASGAPGSYVHIVLSLPAGGSPVNASFAVVAAPVAQLYTGATQLAPWSRYSYVFGPFLLAAVGAWDGALNCGVINGSAVPGFDPASPAEWLSAPPGTPAGALPAGTDFSVRGVPGVSLRPYYRVGSETFTAFPIVVPSA